MSTTDPSCWTPLEASSNPFSPFGSSLPHTGSPSTHTGFACPPNADLWIDSRNNISRERSLANNQARYSAAHGGPADSRLSPHGQRQTAFAHGEYVDASYLPETVTSPMSLDPLHSASDIFGFRAAMRSDSLVSPSGTITDFLGPQTGHSMHTDPGFSWALEENPTVRNPSLQSYSAQSLSPALSNEQNPLQSPKLEQEDSDSSHRRSVSAGRKKPRRKTHNAIEKRYRVKLNEKIAELRDSIPSLRQQAATTPGGSPLGESSATDPVSGQKINKANILEKATEYVKHLENSNRRLQSELHRARAEAGARCQHPSHVITPQNYVGREASQGPAYGYDPGPPRQGHSDAIYSVEDLFGDDVRQV